MGLDKHALKFILRNQPKLGRVLTLGRQHIKYPDEYCEMRLRLNGASQVDSMDVSDYEDATIIHDLNVPVRSRHYGKYDTIYDGGTLEHVYDFPVAFKNVSDMLVEKGVFVSAQLLNYTGHGFYTLNPELLIKASIYNHMMPIEIKIARAIGPFKLWHSIPITLMKRIEISSFFPLIMLFAARKDSMYSGNFPVQSGPTLNSHPIKHFLWDTRLWNHGN